MNKFMFFDVLVTIGLLVSGFIVPPSGVIHPTVLTACGILSFLSLIILLPTILSEKRKTTLTHGNTSVTIEDLIKDANISKEEFDAINKFHR